MEPLVHLNADPWSLMKASCSPVMQVPLSFKIRPLITQLPVTPHMQFTYVCMAPHNVGPLVSNNVGPWCRITQAHGPMIHVFSCNACSMVPHNVGFVVKHVPIRYCMNKKNIRSHLNTLFSFIHFIHYLFFIVTCNIYNTISYNNNNI